MTTIDRAISFPTAKRGYDAAAVDEHLDTTQTRHRAEIGELRAEIRALQAALDDASQREEAVHMTLVAATKTRDEMLATAEAKLDEATAIADAEAAAMLKDSKFEAFRLVTDARGDADTILSEARERAEAALPEARAEAQRLVTEAERRAAESLAEARRDAAATAAAARNEADATTAAAQAGAEGITTAARTEAMEILREAQADAVTLTEERDLELQRIRDDLADQRTQLEERVAALWAEAETLEARVEAVRVVADELPEPPAGGITKTRFSTGAVEPIAVEPPDPESETARQPEPVVTTASTVGHDTALPAAGGDAAETVTVQVEDEDTEDGDPALPVRGSFYSRRSAKLPSIGEGAGRSALAAMSGLRGQIIAEDEREEGDRENDLASQTA